ncbi:polyphosphate polymerase domain-containing protein [Cellulomonas sp. 179-A 4D5 NHS]|uniref:polyphosphate polymerase domain-containing protein n=1 Tax=Cellulomonas sp. 179-A 4D5 NHS TaxID=3142378 RepID=UPI0039A3E46E
MDGLAPVTLAELAEHAALQTRVDRKYVLPTSAARHFVSDLAGSARVLEINGSRDFGYASVYFDTADLDCYRMAAHRRPMRFKVRTRTYVDSAQCWLEVKTRDRRGRTVKHRQAHDVDHRDHLTTAARAFVLEVLAAAAIDVGPLDLRPALVTEYRRATLYLPGDESRLTLDTGLVCRQDGAGAVLLPGRVVVETKTAFHASAADRLLWRSGYRPTRISKYGTGIAALRPELPATPWRPILRHHPFTPDGAEPWDRPLPQHPHRHLTAAARPAG